jgi:hypothetical protein
MNKKVYVANLPFQATEPELKALFSRAGSVMSVKIVKDRQTGQPRGIAFVEMSTQWEGRRAAIDQKFLKSQKVEILRSYLHPTPLIGGSGLYPVIHWP